jgi:hypothetical protein
MSNEPDEVNSGALATALVLVAFTTLAVALVVTALVRDRTAEVLAVKDLTQSRAYRQLRAEQLGSLVAAPAWSDRATGSVSVPVERAMAMVIEEVTSNPYALTPRDPKEEEEEETESEEAEEIVENDASAEGDSAGVDSPGDEAADAELTGEQQPKAATPIVPATPKPASSAQPAPAPSAQPEPKATPAPKLAPAPAVKPAPLTTEPPERK